MDGNERDLCGACKVSELRCMCAAFAKQLGANPSMREVDLVADGLTGSCRSGESGRTTHLRLQMPPICFGGWGGQHECKQCPGCTTARDYDIMESVMRLGLQDDAAHAAHVLDACPAAVTSKTLPQLQVRAHPCSQSSAR